MSMSRWNPNTHHLLILMMMSLVVCLMMPAARRPLVLRSPLALPNQDVTKERMCTAIRRMCIKNTHRRKVSSICERCESKKRRIKRKQHRSTRCFAAPWASHANIRALRRYAAMLRGVQRLCGCTCARLRERCVRKGSKSTERDRVGMGCAVVGERDRKGGREEVEKS
jgi:hypothetical protein